MTNKIFISPINLKEAKYLNQVILTLIKEVNRLKSDVEELKNASN